MVKKTVIFIVGLFLSTSFACADTVYLKSGKTVEGRITEKADDHIKINFQGVELTYYNDEISRISPRDTVTAKETLSPQSYVPHRQQITASKIPSQGKKSFLWKVASGNSTVYLLGSVHIAKKELYPLPKNIEAAFRSADTLVVEVNINDTDALLSTQQLTLQASMYAQPDTLEKHLSAKTHELARTKLGELGLDISQFGMFKPWFVAMTIMGLEMKRLGFDPEWGVDIYFLRQAAGKKIVELENADFQIKLLSGLSDSQQNLFLFYTIIDLNNLEKGLDALLQAWSLGDIAAMEELTFRGLAEHPEMLPIYEKLLYERNITMASKIEGFLKEGGTRFVVIGSGHLLGSKGILKLLERKGYIAEQL